MNPVILERMRESQKESVSCSICCEELTLKNIVNPECGHATCKDCFWRWAKDKNTCPFCRTHLLKNDEETKDIQHMRDVLAHRDNIVRQVEESYEENDKLISICVGLKKKKNIYETDLEILETRRLNYIKRLDALQRANSGTYKTYRYFKEKYEESKEKYEEIKSITQQEHKDKFKAICKDIKILGYKAEKIYYVKGMGVTRISILLTKIYRMNKIRKQRRDFRLVRDNDSMLNLLEKMFVEPSEVEYDILNEEMWNWSLLYATGLLRPVGYRTPIPRTPITSRISFRNITNNYQYDIEEVN